MSSIHTALLEVFKTRNMHGEAPWESDLKNKIGTKLVENIKLCQKRFSEYKSRSLLIKMYSTILGAGAIYDVNIPRINRLKSIAKALDKFNGPSRSILDYGAGSGLISLAVKKSWKPETYVVWDLCSELRFHLEEQGFVWDSGTESFDFILCADSLGECNSDEGDELKSGLLAKSPDAGILIEAHYGFYQQLLPLLGRLNPGGCLVLTEPVPLNSFWIQLALFLKQQGLAVQFLWEPEPVQGIIVFKQD